MSKETVYRQFTGGAYLDVYFDSRSVGEFLDLFELSHDQQRLITLQLMLELQRQLGQRYIIDLRLEDIEDFPDYDDVRLWPNISVRIRSLNGSEKYPCDMSPSELVIRYIHRGNIYNAWARTVEWADEQEFTR